MPGGAGEASFAGAAGHFYPEGLMSPLAEAVYEILRRRAPLDEPRISYAELSAQLRAISEAFTSINHRSRSLYAALVEVGQECRRLGLPPLPALVVRADTRRPGSAYFESKSGGTIPVRDQVASWWRDLEAVRATTYPPRQAGGLEKRRGGA
jgi:hypothetical protein